MYRFALFAGVVTLSLLGALTYPGNASAQNPGVRAVGAARPLPRPVAPQIQPTPRPAPRPTPGQIKTLPSVTPHPWHTPHPHGHHGPWGHGDWHHGHPHHGHWHGVPGPFGVPLIGAPSLFGPGITGGGSSVAPAASSPAETADLVRAVGDYIKGAEEARILREESEMMRLETIKKRAETKAYIESITPTWGERQIKIAKQKLAYSQTTTDAGIIHSGQALNTLLDDLRKHVGKKSFSVTQLGEEVLGRINVTTRRNGANLALLGRGGSLAWPTALCNEAIVAKKDRTMIETKAQALIENAVPAEVARQYLVDLKAFVDTAGVKLARKINDIPGQYLEAKRFLDGLDAARIALENGEADTYRAFRAWVSGGKTIQEVAAYMIREGLQFAPATTGDERAYRATHSALAAYDVDVNQNAGTIASTDLK